jgi:hypothetical protein
MSKVEASVIALGRNLSDRRHALGGDEFRGHHGAVVRTSSVDGVPIQRECLHPTAWHFGGTVMSTRSVWISTDQAVVDGPSPRALPRFACLYVGRKAEKLLRIC